MPIAYKWPLRTAWQSMVCGEHPHVFPLRTQTWHPHLRRPQHYFTPAEYFILAETVHHAQSEQRDVPQLPTSLFGGAWDVIRELPSTALPIRSRCVVDWPPAGAHPDVGGLSECRPGAIAGRWNKKTAAHLKDRPTVNQKALDLIKSGGSEDTRTLRRDCGSDAHRPPSHISKIVLSTVHVGGQRWMRSLRVRSLVALSSCQSY